MSLKSNYKQKTKRLEIFVLIIVVLSTVYQSGAVPPIPPIPNPPTPPPETPPPSSGSGTVPLIEEQQRFEVIPIEPVMEGYAGGSID